jgi:predicted methyltransferase
MLTFAGVNPGDKVLEFVRGRGYVTRLLAKAVGTAGHVYAANLPTFNEAFSLRIISAGVSLGAPGRLRQRLVRVWGPP